MAIMNSSQNQQSLQQSENPTAGGALMMAVDYEVVEQRMKQLQRFVQNYMKPGEDYGTVGGINKPTLLKSGAEKLCDVYGLSAGEPTIDYTRDDTKTPTYISYRVVIPLISRVDGRTIMTGVGSCNSHEKKHKWRWVFESELPPGVNSHSLKSKKVGKNEQYLKYRIPNDEIDDLDNTILKTAKKRALVDAVLSATRSSAMFTQDVEDMDIKPVDNDQRYEQRQNRGSTNANGNRNRTMEGPSTEAQINAIFGGAKRKNLTEDEAKALAKKIHKVDSMKDLSKQQASDMITLMNQSDEKTLRDILGISGAPDQGKQSPSFSNFDKSVDISDDDLPF